jgi:thioredoxin-like negative regulator of GroEL
MKVIKIGAEWCPQCKMLDKKFEGFDACELTTYDAEENEDIVEKYGIRNIPVTILLDDNENVIHRWVGLFDINEINEKIKEINNG